MLGYDDKLPDAIMSSLNLDKGQRHALSDLLDQAVMQIPLLSMPLQDCVDLATFFIRTTIDAQRLTVGRRGCGGPIDVATITRNDGLQFVQRKRITGDGA